MDKFFTEQQATAIEYSGNMVITACPGSGKTTVIAEKVRKIVSRLESYQGVIAITFTKKASQELRKRCRNEGCDTKQSFFGTIDKFCLEEIIYPFLSHLWQANTKKCDVIKVLTTEHKKLLLKNYNVPTLSDIVADDGFEEIYKQGFLWMSAFSGIAYYILNHSVAAVKYIKAKYKYIFIDEYQDSSKAQHELFLKLVDLGLTGVAVGDKDQSIYAFRESSPEYLNDLIDRKKNFQDFHIDINHRCHPSIVNYASRLLNPSYQTQVCADGECRVYHYQKSGTPTQMAPKISALIEDLILVNSGLKYSNIAILANKKKVLESIAVGLTTNYRLYIDTPLEEINSQSANLFFDLLAFRFGRIGTAQEVIDKHLNFKASRMSSIRKKLIQIGSFEGNELIQKLCSIADELDYNYGIKEIEAMQKIIEDNGLLKLFKSIDQSEIQLMTIHKSKGLEFHTVIHVGLEEWIFPHREYTGSWGDPPFYPDIDQEMNLHYVGITRAQENCLLIHSTKRVNSRNEEKRAQPSYFLTLPQLVGLYEQK